MSSLNYAPFKQNKTSYVWTKVSPETNNINVNVHNYKGNTKKSVYTWNNLEYPKNYTQNVNGSKKNHDLDRMMKICSYQNM